MRARERARAKVRERLRKRARGLVYKLLEVNTKKSYASASKLGFVWMGRSGFSFSAIRCIFFFHAMHYEDLGRGGV